jgi:hypothetical protein
MPSGNACRRINREPFKRSDRGSDGRISNSTPGFCLLSGQRRRYSGSSPFIQNTRRAPESLRRTSGTFGPRRPAQTLSPGGLERPPVLTAFERDGMVEANPTRSCYTDSRF